MKILVTGANGFVGSNVVKELLKDRREVKIIIRKNSDTRNIDGLDVEIVYGDIRDKDSISLAIQGCDTLYHIAAYYSSEKIDAKIMYDINVEGTKNVLNSALEKETKKVVYTSTIGTIGQTTNRSLPNEETPFNLWNTASDYVKSKYLAELEALKLYEKGLPVVIVNPCAPVGAGDIKPSVSGQRILDYLNGKIPPYPEGGINWIHVRDVARGHILAAERGGIGAKYILGNRNLSVTEFLELMEKVTGSKPMYPKTPGRVSQIRSYLSKFLRKETKSLPVLTCDCSKAVRELNLPQIPIEEAMKEAVSWFSKYGYVQNSMD